MARFREFVGPMGEVFAIDIERVGLIEPQVVVMEGGKVKGVLTLHVGNGLGVRTTDIDSVAVAFGLSAEMVYNFKEHIFIMSKQAEAELARQKAGLVTATPMPHMNGQANGLRLRN